MNKVSGDPPLGAWVPRLLGQPPQALLARGASSPPPIHPTAAQGRLQGLLLPCPLLPPGGKSLAHR